MAEGLSCSAACGIFLDQGLNPYFQHWQADSLPLSHQGSPGRRSVLFKWRKESHTCPLSPSFPPWRQPLLLGLGRSVLFKWIATSSTQLSGESLLLPGGGGCCPPHSCHMSYSRHRFSWAPQDLGALPDYGAQELLILRQLRHPEFRLL